MKNSRLFEEVVPKSVKHSLMEDIGQGDATTNATVSKDARAEGMILCKESGVLAGMPIAEEVFRQVDPDVVFKPTVKDGTKINEGNILAKLSGPTRGILIAERTALNFLQRMSGIATLTSRFVEAVAGTGAKILDTRKTTPGLRLLEKYAVRCGGGRNHRMGLYDMVMIKDNHIVAAGSITKAINAVKTSRTGLKIEVECKSIEQVREALAAGQVHRIMLDNMSLEMMKEAVSLVSGQVELEASGGVSLQTVRAVAQTGVDYISVGALTHSANALDISLEITEIK